MEIHSTFKYHTKNKLILQSPVYAKLFLGKEIPYIKSQAFFIMRLTAELPTDFLPGGKKEPAWNSLRNA